jgi:Txe/YoeB family toxin of Txe-Axe toxin-antitoxin module
MKGITSFVVLLAQLSGFCLCLTAVPLLVASHKLVPGLKDEISDETYVAHNQTSVTNMIKKLITKCSSDTYMIINQPGLKYEDINDFRREDWKFIYKYTVLASTVIGLPFVNEPLDLDYIEEYARMTCEAETMFLKNQNDDEIEEYFDTRTRVIRVELPELSQDKQERFSQIRHNDELLRKILRKLPSPHYTIILTSTLPVSFHPLPQFVYSDSPQEFNVFSLITDDPSRLNEVERNDRFHRPVPDFNVNRHTNNRYLENKKKDEIHFFDYDLWTKNEKLIMTIFIMILTLVLKKFFEFINSIKSKIVNKNKSKGLIGSTKKVD